MSTRRGAAKEVARACALLVAVWAAAFAPCAAADGAKGEVTKGKVIATAGLPSGVPACIACHGSAGEGQAAAAIPRLAGLDASYLQAQLAAFKSGTRANGSMSGIATAMESAAIADVAAYYASLAAPPVEASAGPPAQVAAGQNLASRGDWAAKIPPCASCHGRNGLGVGAAFPPVAGQSAAYITAQLKAWRSGTRHDDPQALMRTVAARLDDTQIAAAAAYYASLPGTPPAPGAQTR